jgi:methyl-accepting chemotaxis protein
MAADTSGQSALSGTWDYAKDCVDQLRNQQKNMLESLEIFENVQNGLEALSQRCSDADKIVLLLKVIALNMGIESNRTKESADMFAAFVTEVRELAGHVDTVIRSLLEDSERIRGEHVKTMAEIRGHVSRLSRLADKADSELKESTKQIEIMMARTLDSLSANRESSEAMARHLGDIVISLQMHDIIRQKTEEVVKDLYATENLIRISRETPGQIRSANMAFETGRKLLELAERVDGIILEVEKTYREVVRSFKGIEHHLADLYQGVGSRVRESEDLSSASNPFSMLSSSLK